MGVDRKIDASELPRIYRRLALQLHPDKTKDNGDAFKELRAAYEVLSNPNERQWYDDHREAILRGHEVEEDDGDDDSTKRKRGPGPNLWPYFSPSCFGPGTAGFFAVYEKVFGLIFTDEVEFGTKDMRGESAPTFGVEGTSIKKVREFYSYWSGFCSSKSFGWADKYQLSSAPNRQVKRMMEKENARIREKHRREYHEQIRSLLDFVKRRDPRILMDSVAQQRRKEELEARSTKRTVSAAERAALDSQRNDHFNAFMQDSRAYLARLEEEFGAETDEDEETEELYCVACRRSFKSQAHFENHEKSKKHLQAVAQLRTEVLLEGETLPDAAACSAESKNPSGNKVKPSEEADEHHELVDLVDESAGLPAGGIESDDDDDDDDEDFALQLAVQRKQKKLQRKHRKQKAKQRFLDSSSDDELVEVVAATVTDEANDNADEVTKDEEEQANKIVDSDTDSDELFRTGAQRKKTKGRRKPANKASTAAPRITTPVLQADADEVGVADGESTPAEVVPPVGAANGKAGKPRRRAAKGARKAAPTPLPSEEVCIVGSADMSFQCRICKASFATKNKLHQHLKKNPSHAREPK